jgi:hypothetical protein
MRNNPLNRIVFTLLTAGWGAFSAPAQLVPSLTSVDVGAPLLPGSTMISAPGSFTVTGSGEYKNGSSDNFQYAYTNVNGDFDFRVRIESLTAPSQYSKVGLMARESSDDLLTTDVGSRYMAMTAYPPPPSGFNTFILIRRELADTPTADDILGTKPVYPNAWLRLRRLGDTLIGFTGTNGVNWDLQGARDTSLWLGGPLNQSLLLGLAAASFKNTAICTAQCREFGPVLSTNPVVVTVPLKSVTVNKGQMATFSIKVSGYDPFSAQWYTNGVPISGGTNYSFGGTLSYRTGPLNLSDDNTVFSVVVRNSVNTITNGNALLRVLDDHTPPSVTAATTDNSEIDVVFNEEVSPAAATDINIYTLNGVEGVSIGAVTLSSNQRVASLMLWGTIDSTNATLTVNGVQDLVANTLVNQTVPLWSLLPASNIVANSYLNDDRQAAFASVTDGAVNAGWQTDGDKVHRPQFAGLIYTNLQTFSVVKLDLGQQNEYGGSFVETPYLFLLKNNVDMGTNGPESDPINWQQVAAPLVSPDLFDANVDLNPSPASPIIFDLSALPLSSRAAYGWAVGGVSGDNSGFIRISEVRGYGESGGVILESPPLMSVASQSANTVVISWPLAAANFAPESAASLDPSSWSALTIPPVVVGTNYTLTLPSTNGTRFYRLKK